MKSADLCISDVFYNKSKKKVSELPIEHQLALSGMP
jgi:hypothetical protein